MKSFLIILLGLCIITSGCILNNKQSVEELRNNQNHTPGFEQDIFSIGKEDSINTGALNTERSVSQNSTFSYTYQNADGNRWVKGKMDLSKAVHLDIPLKGTPVWLAAAALHNDSGSQSQDESIWIAVLKNGEIQGFRISHRSTGPVIEQKELVPSVNLIPLPPLIKNNKGTIQLIHAPGKDMSLSTHPIVLSDGRIVYIAENGDLVFWQQQEIYRLKIDALRDARILVDEKERLLLFTKATIRYPHGVLGDNTEAGALALIDTSTIPRVIKTIKIDGKHIFEGILPLWVDWNQDGTREIIVTLSNSEMGAQIVMFDELGNQLADGPPIGKGNRWRHQLMVAPLGPKGEMELVDVLTPHINGVIEFYRWEDKKLNIVANLAGFSSHVIGSRNLDMALAADFNHDGRMELLIPNQEKTELSIIKRTKNSAVMTTSLTLNGLASTNLSSAVFPNGEMLVGIGRQDGVLRIWMNEKISANSTPSQFSN